MSGRRPQVSVIGGEVSNDDLVAKARDVGRAIAEAGWVLVCGGLGGVMAAAAEGAHSAGGDVIGIVPMESPDGADPNVTHAVATGIGQARNLAVVASGDAVIAVGGSFGTLSEIGFARKLGRPVISLESWALQSRYESDLGIVEVDSAEAAIGAVRTAFEG